MKIELEPMDEILDIILEDDETEFGGVAFYGETVRDFITELEYPPETLAELNEKLMECGIKPIYLQ